ncbi:hypothetical protein [Variovorax sp. EBFNA2]|uniref:hypothetical protein n=1 Tax=Variovorax sp. EBFNA2 TaxID=3342097 RepID=UPI0029BFFB56|nr:hypothetical protein [Variovorax boronicumulans]WPG40132.1 hypothetical protein RZE79_12525 [Variovorax boronicumulans]
MTLPFLEGAESCVDARRSLQTMVTQRAGGARARLGRAFVVAFVLRESYSTHRPLPTPAHRRAPDAGSSPTTRSPRVNSIIYIVGLVVVVVAVLSFFGLR